MQLRWQDYVEENREILAGKPVFKGTRLSVEFILRQMATGMKADELLNEYPTLREEHLQAAILYAADLIEMEQTIYK
ncbi:MAG: DUF433 domain-containing protein [Isosphaeraceae bacterium]